MKLYAYDEDTREVIAIAIADTTEQCEQIITDFCNDDYPTTYSPAFGFADGLIDNGAPKLYPVPAIDRNHICAWAVRVAKPTCNIDVIVNECEDRLRDDYSAGIDPTYELRGFYTKSGNPEVYSPPAQ